MKIKYYIDMDGVLAKWNSRVSIEDTFKKGYFLNVEPDQLAINYVTELINRGEDVCVLSHAYQNGYAESEKKQWLIDNGLGNIPCIFVPYGMPKLNFVTLFPDTTNILIDDFSKNLHEWEEIKNNIGIKYYNGINGNHGTWKGNCINPELAPMRNKDEQKGEHTKMKIEESEKEMLDISYYRMFISLEDDIKSYIKYQNMIKNADDKELIQYYTEAKYNYLERIDNSVWWAFNDNMDIVDDDEGRLNYSVVKRYFVDNEIEENKSLEVNDGNILHILREMKIKRFLYDLRYKVAHDNYYKALGFDKEKVDNRIKVINHKFDKEHEYLRDKEDGMYDNGVPQYSAYYEDDELSLAEERFEKRVRFYRTTGIVPSTIISEIELEMKNITGYLNHETLGQLNIYKTPLDYDGNKNYALLKIENKPSAPFIVADWDDVKEGKLQEYNYYAFNDYKDAENCFKIETELNTNYYRVVSLMSAYEGMIWRGLAADDGQNLYTDDLDKLINENNYELNLIENIDKRNEEDRIRMSYDLKTNTFKYYLNDKLIAQESYCLDDLEKDLSYEDYNIFYDATLDKVDEYRKGEEVEGTIFFRDEENTNELIPNTDSLEMLKEEVEEKELSHEDDFDDLPF